MSDTLSPSMYSHDTKVHLSWDYKPSWKPEECAKEPAHIGLVAVVRLLRAQGFKVVKDMLVGSSIRQGHRIANKGDLWLYVEQCGRILEIEGYVEYNSDNRHGGRYCFNKRQRMSYLDGKRFDVIARRIHALFPEATKRPTIEHLKGLEWILADRRAEPGSNRFYDPKWTFVPGEAPKNALGWNGKAADGSQLVDQQPVYFFGYDGRLQKGFAYHNINNMWWVLLPCGTIRNTACFEIYPQGAVTRLRGRWGDSFARKARRTLKNLLKRAKDSDRLEDAIRYRDALLKMGPEE